MSEAAGTGMEVGSTAVPASWVDVVERRSQALVLAHTYGHPHSGCVVVPGAVSRWLHRQRWVRARAKARAMARWRVLFAARDADGAWRDGALVDSGLVPRDGLLRCMASWRRACRSNSDPCVCTALGVLAASVLAGVLVREGARAKVVHGAIADGLQWLRLHTPLALATPFSSTGPWQCLMSLATRAAS
jgi:hypothetical protein